MPKRVYLGRVARGEDGKYFIRRPKVCAMEKRESGPRMREKSTCVYASGKRPAESGVCWCAAGGHEAGGAVLSQGVVRGCMRNFGPGRLGSAALQSRRGLPAGTTVLARRRCWLLHLDCVY